jgi:NAD+ synthase (glutamine-hydrolysing)
MRVGIAQLNCVVGDLRGNAARILEAVAEAQRGGADLVVTPELSLCGYPPEDLLLRPAFLAACAEELHRLAAQISGPVVLVGFPEFAAGKRHNALAVLRDGRVAAVYRKRELPNYTVFDEQRYFEPGTETCVIDVAGVRVGIVICEDIWFPRAAQQTLAAGAQLIVVPNGSPYHTHQQALRRGVVTARARETGLAVVYVNRVGGQDELVFDGASFVVDGSGSLAQQVPAWREAVALVEFTGATPKAVRGALDTALEPHVYAALCTGVRDYVDKNHFASVLIGLSGGIDSALTLAIAVDALGSARVRAVMLPSPYNAAISLEDARTMAAITGVRYDEIPIDPVFQALRATLADEFKGLAEDASEENMQHGAIVLTTGNKSEMAVGYATLYGDMAGGFAVLKDISKTLVYRLAHYRNRFGRVIPERVITRAPSAELRPNQTDQDSLPPYAVLDAILEAYVEEDLSPAEIVARGYAPEHVARVVRLIKTNEYKRRQAAVGIRITPRGFGKDWRYPISSAWAEWKSVSA